ALRKLGRLTQPALLKAATLPLPSADRESVSSIRRRRSALGLLSEIGMPPEPWPALRQLLKDSDGKIAMLACKIFLTSGPIQDRKYAVRRLIDLLPDADWILAQDIEDCLVTQFEQAKDIISATIQRKGAPLEHDAGRDRITRAALLHIKARAETTRTANDNQN